MSTSQDFRDGAGYGARNVAQRLVMMSSWGVPLTDAVIRAVGEGMASEMGAAHTDRVPVTVLYQEFRYQRPE